MRRYLLVVLLASLLAGCAGRLGPDDSDTLNSQAIALRRLASAVQGEVWLGAGPGEDLLALAYAKDPSLRQPLKDNIVLVNVVEGNVALLLCTPDGARALIEDAACTPQPDLKAWEAGTLPCRFTLQPQEFCR